VSITSEGLSLVQPHSSKSIRNFMMLFAVSLIAFLLRASAKVIPKESDIRKPGISVNPYPNEGSNGDIMKLDAVQTSSSRFDAVPNRRIDLDAAQIPPNMWGGIPRSAEKFEAVQSSTNRFQGIQSSTNKFGEVQSGTNQFKGVQTSTNRFQRAQDNAEMNKEKSDQKRGNRLARVGASGFESFQFFFNVTLEEIQIGSEKDDVNDEVYVQHLNEEGGLWKKREGRSDTRGGLWKRDERRTDTQGRSLNKDESRMNRPAGLWRKVVRAKDQGKRVVNERTADKRNAPSRDMSNERKVNAGLWKEDLRGINRNTVSRRQEQNENRGKIERGAHQ